MKTGKYLAPKKSGKKRYAKPLAVIAAAALTVGCIAGSTLAWLTAKTNPISNTFSVGNIILRLEETHTIPPGADGNIKFVPGQSWKKDTTVIIEGGSEKCYLFIHIDEQNNTLPDPSTEKIIQWDFASEDWTPVPNHDGYYYRTVASAITDTRIKLIANDELTINENVTKEMKPQLDAARPHLSFTAAAIQFDHLPDKTGDGKVNEADAWELLPADFKPNASP